MDTDPLQADFPRARCLIQIVRVSTHKKTGKQTTLTRFFVSDRRPDQIPPAQWLSEIRGHWAGVEIRNHWLKDAILCEDKTRSRHPTIVGALALLRAALLRLFYPFRLLYGTLVATVEVLRLNPSIALGAIYRKNLT